MKKKVEKPPHIELKADLNGSKRTATWGEGEFVIEVTRGDDDDADLSWLGTFSHKPGPNAVDHHANRGNSRDFRYFNPGQDYKDVSSRLQKKYIMRDYERLCDYGERWFMTYIEVDVKLEGYVIGSASVCGVESDANDDYIDGMVADLKNNALIDAQAEVLSLAKNALTIRDKK